MYLRSTPSATCNVSSTNHCDGRRTHCECPRLFRWWLGRRGRRMLLRSRCRANIDVSKIMGDCTEINSWGALFGESLGRILVSVEPQHCAAFEAAMNGHACYSLGNVEAGDQISISNGDETILTASTRFLTTGCSGKAPSMEVVHNEQGSCSGALGLWN